VKKLLFAIMALAICSVGFAETHGSVMGTNQALLRRWRKTAHHSKVEVRKLQESS